MANDLNSAVNALKGILGDDAGDKIQSVMQSLSSSSDADNSAGADNTPIPQKNAVNDNTLEYIMQMKNIFDEMSHGGDDRSNLLLSLRPYMREGRRKSIDNALRLMTLTKLSGVFGKL